MATIAAKKSEACPTSGVLIKTRATRADSGFPGRAGRGRGPSGPSRAGQNRLCAHSAGQAFLFPHGQCKKKTGARGDYPASFFFHARSRFYVVVKDPFPKYAISWQPVIAAAVCAAFVSFSLTTHPFSQKPNERPFEEGQLNRRKL